DCELTETYSPAAMDMAPAASPATPATRTAPGLGSAAATPTISEDTETIPALAPSTAARSHPERLTDGISSAADCYGGDMSVHHRPGSLDPAYAVGRPVSGCVRTSKSLQKDQASGRGNVALGVECVDKDWRGTSREAERRRVGFQGGSNG